MVINPANINVIKGYILKSLLDGNYIYLHFTFAQHMNKSLCLIYDLHHHQPFLNCIYQHNPHLTGFHRTIKIQCLGTHFYNLSFLCATFSICDRFEDISSWDYDITFHLNAHKWFDLLQCIDVMMSKEIGWIKHWVINPTYKIKIYAQSKELLESIYYFKECYQDIMISVYNSKSNNNNIMFSIADII
jgi:hypothetical protein